jgi:hypothetical protein
LASSCTIELLLVLTLLAGVLRAVIIALVVDHTSPIILVNAKQSSRLRKVEKAAVDLRKLFEGLSRTFADIPGVIAGLDRHWRNRCGNSSVLHSD